MTFSEDLTTHSSLTLDHEIAGPYNEDKELNGF